jgi:endonuclease YncB( thermonuclease family)
MAKRDQRAGGWALAVLVALVGPFMAILDSGIVNVAVPTIMRVSNGDTVTVEGVRPPPVSAFRWRSE